MKVICGKKYSWYAFVDDNVDEKAEQEELDELFKQLNKGLKK